MSGGLTSNDIEEIRWRIHNGYNVCPFRPEQDTQRLLTEVKRLRSLYNGVPANLLGQRDRLAAWVRGCPMIDEAGRRILAEMEQTDAE